MIHETAVIDKSARIGERVQIGAFSVIGADVEIGDDTVIGSHVVILGPTKIGKRNKIRQFAALGDAPQSKKYAGEPTRLEIGDDNHISEFVTIHRGTVEGGGLTQVNNNNFIMAYVHIAHDCKVGSEIIFANNAALSGHVTVGDHANFGGFSAIHQFCSVGSYAFVAGETSVPKDVPPYVLVSGHPASVFGLNQVGLKRKGFSDEVISELRKAYNVIYRQGYTAVQAVEQLEELLPTCKEIQVLIDSLNHSKRGIVR